MPRFHVVRVKQSTDPESAQLGSTREIDRAEDGALLRERERDPPDGGGLHKYLYTSPLLQDIEYIRGKRFHVFRVYQRLT